MRTILVPLLSRCRVDSEYVIYLGIDRKVAEIIGNKLTHKHDQF